MEECLLFFCGLSKMLAILHSHIIFMRSCPISSFRGALCKKTLKGYINNMPSKTLHPKVASSMSRYMYQKSSGIYCALLGNSICLSVSYNLAWVSISFRPRR